MRRALVLLLLCSLAACRKVEAPAGSAPVAEAPAPATSGPDAEAGTGQEESTAPAEEQPAPAAVAEPAPAPASAAEAPVTPPPAGGQFVAGQGSGGAPEEEKPDTGIYSWVDGDGVVHYGGADEIPAGQRKQARVVDSGVTVVESTPPALPPPAPPPPLRRPPEQDESPAPAGSGPEPERDEQGLPIPGTMQDTAATRAAAAAGQQGLDPAAVQRRHEEELRRMNCREKDGVMVCG